MPNSLFETGGMPDPVPGFCVGRSIQGTPKWKECIYYSRRVVVSQLRYSYLLSRFCVRIVAVHCLYVVPTFFVWSMILDKKSSLVVASV